MKTIIGTMSGTSMDGVDAAVLTTDGEQLGAVGETHFRAYSKAERAQIMQAMQACREKGRDNPHVCEADRMVTNAHFEAINALLEKAGMTAKNIDLIGFHGQTIYHAPDEKRTVQLCDGETLAQKTGIAVAYDFRQADMAAGGEGAPLVPIFHKALLRDVEKPSAILNIGGVSNITIVMEDRFEAFDTGPGNAYIDDWIRSRTSRRFDEWGRIAGEGAVNQIIVNEALSHPYFDRSPPKSLDRDAFESLMKSRALDRLSLADGAATLTAFSALSIVKALKAYPLKTVYVCGGGAKNRTLSQMIEKETGLTLQSAEMLGYDPDFLEAFAFAFLAARAERGLAYSFPETTGVQRPTCGGVIARPD